jgi:Zn-dependent metalloprotease
VLRSTRTTITVAVGGVVAGALTLAGVPAQAAPASSASARGAVLAGARAPQAVRSDTSPGPRVLTTPAGRPLARPSGLPAGASPSAVATAVVTARAAQLGVRGSLRTASVRKALGGGSIVRLEQTFGGVPVIGGEVVVDVDDAGRTRSAISETLPGAAPSTSPRLTRQWATTAIGRLVAKHTDRAVSDLSVATPTLALYDPTMLGAPALPGVSGARLVWRSEVTGRSDLGLRRLVLLDAQNGKTALHLDMINGAGNRQVCDAGGLDRYVPCLAANYIASPGSSLVDDIKKAYDYAGETYDFYHDVLGRDSIDGAGMTILSTVNYCPTGATCPYANAFWNGSQMVYGATYATADDVVAHELTHGVTEKNNGLFYYFQSGAINESLSDIFGEFVDLTDGVGTDTPETRWKMGEDLPIGAIRDMEDPGLFGDPDSTDSPNWDANTITEDLAFDSGGVHGNSGVGNKFAFLLTDGTGAGTFNGVSVTGVGITAAAKVIYRASQTMTSATDYRGFAAALRTACTALQSDPDVDADTCVSVNAAITVVKMDAVPTAVPVATPAVCPTGTVSATRWADSMTNPSSGLWTANQPITLSGVPWSLWYYSDRDTIYGPKTSPHYGTEKLPTSANLWGDDPGVIPFETDSSIAMRTGFTVPSGTSYLRFTHAFGFETNIYDLGDPLENFDGGVVEYSVNGGAWKDAGPLMAGAGNNGYGFNKGLDSQRAGGLSDTKIALEHGNPLAGRAAFTWQSQGYVTTRATLSSLAGKKVKFRFRIGADNIGGDYGWFIDRVSMYSCVPLLQLSTPPAVATGPTTLSWAANDRSSRTVTTYRLATAPFGKPLSAFGSPRTASSSRSLSVPLTKNGTTCVSVTSRDLDTGLTSSAGRCITSPVDDRSMKASAGWKKQSSSSAFAKTLRVATKKGKTLTLSGARGGHVTVLARAVKNGGKVGVYVNGRKIATISLSAKRTTATRYDYAVSGLAGTVKLKVLTSGKPVTIDAVGVRL